MTEPQTPPPPGLEDHIAYALLTQGTHDRSGATRQAYQTARTLSRTTSEEFKELVNDFWVDPSSGLKASCLTHALLSGNQAVADMLEAHGAEESFVYPATDLEIRKT